MFTTILNLEKLATGIRSDGREVLAASNKLARVDHGEVLDCGCERFANGRVDRCAECADGTLIAYSAVLNTSATRPNTYTVTATYKGETAVFTAHLFKPLDELTASAKLEAFKRNELLVWSETPGHDADEFEADDFVRMLGDDLDDFLNESGNWDRLIF